MISKIDVLMIAKIDVFFKFRSIFDYHFWLLV